jgi:hypothetical protein
MDIFDEWNKKKKITHDRMNVPAFRVRGIWWIQLGKNIASESLGKGEDFLRPVIIFQKFYGHSAFVIPLSTQKKEGSYYFSFKDSGNFEQTAILSQGRYIDGRRLFRKSAKIGVDTFASLQAHFFKLMKNNPQPNGGGS